MPLIIAKTAAMKANFNFLPMFVCHFGTCRERCSRWLGDYLHRHSRYVSCITVKANRLTACAPDRILHKAALTLARPAVGCRHHRGLGVPQYQNRGTKTFARFIASCLDFRCVGRHGPATHPDRRGFHRPSTDLPPPSTDLATHPYNPPPGGSGAVHGGSAPSAATGQGERAVLAWITPAMPIARR
jgi:hypothetical protein